MPTTTSRASYDTYTSEQFNNQNFGIESIMKLSAGSGTRRFAYVYFGGMPPHGASVSSATLTFTLRGSGWSGGPHTITAKRINATWSESKLTWTRSGSGQMADSTPTGTVSVTGGSDGQAVSIDVTSLVGPSTSAQPWYGIRLEVNTGSNVQRDIYSSETFPTDNRPELSVTWSRPPDAPSNLAPGGGLAVSKQFPTLKWSFKDPDGDDQAKFQVQIASSSATGGSGFTSAEYDSGWVSSNQTQLESSTTSWAGISASATRYWMVRVQDVNGLISPWSSVQSFTRTAKGSLAIVSPADGGFVEETTAPITTILTGHAQDAIAYSLEEEQPASVSFGIGAAVSWKEVWSTGRFDAQEPDGTAFNFTIPDNRITKNNTNYRLTVWSYDAVDREATPGDPLYISAQSVFTFERSAVPEKVANLTVTQSEPGALITFTRSTEPNYFALRIDGVLVADRIVPGDYFVSGTTYGFSYYGMAGNESHTVEVEAVDNNGTFDLTHSQGNTVKTFTPMVRSIWITDAGDTAVYAEGSGPDMVCLSGQDSQTLSIGESSATFYPIGRRDPVRVVDAIRGLEGTISGTLLDDDVSTMSVRLQNFKDPNRSGAVYRLIMGTLNIPVQLATVQIAPLPMPTENAFSVQVDVAQVGEFL